VSWPSSVYAKSQDASAIAIGALEEIGFKGLGNMVKTTGAFIDTISDSEMALSDTTKQPYLYRALGGEYDQISPLAAYRFGDFPRAQSKARQAAEAANAQYGANSAQHAASLAVLATVHEDASFAQQNNLAEDYWRNAIAIYRQLGQSQAEGMALLGYSRHLVRDGRQHELLVVHDRLLALPGLEQDQKMLALPLAATIDAWDGKFTPALRKLATALQYWDSRQTADQVATADLTRNLFGSFMQEDVFAVVPQLESARILAQAAEMLRSVGRTKASIELFDAAIAKSRGSAGHYRPERIDIFIRAAEAKAQLGRYEDAGAAVKTAGNMQRWNITLFGRAVADQKHAKALLLEHAGELAGAEQAFRYSLAWWQSDLAASTESLRPVIGLANLYARRGRAETADYYAKMAVCFADKIDAAGTANRERAGVLLRASYVAFLDDMASQLQINPTPQAIANAFRAAQLADSGETAQSIEVALEMRAKTNTRVAQLMKRREQISAELSRARRAKATEFIRQSGLVAEIERVAMAQADDDAQSRNIWLSRVGELSSNTGTQTSALSTEKLAADLAQINREVATSADGRQFLQRQTVSLAEVGAALSPDEAFIQFVVAEEKTFIIAADKESAMLAEASSGRVKIERAVNSLRAALRGPVPGKFDAQTAADLFRILLQPVSNVIDGKRRLIVVKDGPLSQLPLAALKRGSAQGQWVIETHSIVSSPTAAAFVISRKQKSSSRAPRAFLGIGDPILVNGKSDDHEAVAKILGLRGDVGGLGDLRELPETTAELKVMAKAMGVEADALVLREAATEKRVRSLNLSNYRMISFATHALMPGETRDNDEGAIVLSSPQSNSSGSEDGLLTSSEIATLKLDADLVILSACNTAAGSDSVGGERLSGLTQAFFRAGARSLLVSHWSVHSEATQDLMARLATNMKQHVRTDVALQRSILEMARGSDARYAHPYYWAAFELYGS